MAKRHHKTGPMLARGWLFWLVVVVLAFSVAAVGLGGWQASELARIKEATAEACKGVAPDVAPEAKEAATKACETARKTAQTAPFTLDTFGDHVWRAAYSILLAIGGDYYFLDYDRFEHRPNGAMKVGSFVLLLLTLVWAYQVLANTLGVSLKLFRYRRLGYDTLVIGNTPFARRAARLLAQDRAGWLNSRRNVVIASPEGSPFGANHSAAAFGRALHLATPFDPVLIDESLPLAMAKGRILIDVGSSAENLAILQGLSHVGEEGLKAEILCRMDDDHLCEEAQHLPAKPPSTPYFFNLNRLAAARALKGLPLYELAEQSGQMHVHLLLVGFGRLGQALMEEALLGSIAGKFGKPRVTIIDNDKAGVQARLHRDYPALALVADVDVIGLDPLQVLRACPDDDCFSDLNAAEAAAPFTAIALALPSDAANIECFLLLSQFRRRNRKPMAPYFLAERSELSTCGLFERSDDASGQGTRSDTVRSVAVEDDALLDLLTQAERRDARAKAIHEQYRAKLKPEKRAQNAWDGLSETMRRSNRRAAAHMDAKVWSMKFFVDGDDAIARFADGGTVQAYRASNKDTQNAIKEELAKLEHQRWMMDRVLDGWRFGENRDDVRKTRPSLKPFSELENEDKEKDLVQIDLVLELLSQDE